MAGRNPCNAYRSSSFLGSNKTAGYNAQQLPFKLKKLVEAHQLSDSDNVDGFEKGCALIRSNLGIDPTVGDYEDWAVNYAQALWLEKWRLKNLNEMLAKMFSSEKGQ